MPRSVRGRSGNWPSYRDGHQENGEGSVTDKQGQATGKHIVKID